VTLTRSAAAAGLLAGVTVAWAALPTSGAAAGERVALIAAICCAVLGTAALAAGSESGREPDSEASWEPLIVRAWRRVTDTVRTVPWAGGLVLATLALEALHRSRPWHTGLLGIALLAFLITTHLAETGARPGVIAPQLPLLAAGLGLLALAVGAAALPGAQAGLASWSLRVLAVAAALAVGALALPL
jgi:hypothetical protein